jgi:hypothetical protein
MYICSKVYYIFHIFLESGIRPPLCQLDEKYLDQLTEALLLGKVQL